MYWSPSLSSAPIRRYASSSGGHLKNFDIWSTIVSMDKAKRGNAVLRTDMISSAYSQAGRLTATVGLCAPPVIGEDCGP